jgi:hypothetical protein
MLLIKGETPVLGFRTLTAEPSAYYLFVFSVSNEDVKFSIASNAHRIDYYAEVEVPVDTHFPLAGMYKYSIYPTDTETLTIPDEEAMKIGYCTVQGEGTEYTEHEPDNAFTVR